MDACCGSTSPELERLRREQEGLLRVVLAINVALFALEVAAGLWARSSALLADSLDMLGDSFVYGMSLFALARSERWKAGAALLKGAIMAAFGLGVLAGTVRQALGATLPVAEAMSAVGAIALAGNAVCFALLYRHRSDDLNLRSTWLCSRNDIVANLAVLAAAGGVLATGMHWPDVVVGAGIALLFLRTSTGVLRESLLALRRPTPLAGA